MRRFNLIALAAFIGALVWVFTFDNDATRNIQNRISGIFAPFKKTGAGVQDAVTGANQEKRTPEELRAHNEKLATENAELKIYRDQVPRLEEELKRLHDLLKFDRQTELALIPAKIIVRKTSAWYRGATIDKGWRQGVQDGSPIILPTGPQGLASLVGRVARAAENESEILFVTDELCKVAGRVEGTNERGILEGVRVSTSRRPELRLRYLAKDARVDKNRRVYSWDYTNRFPRELMLGTVVDFRPGDASSEAIVEPAVNLDDLPYVFVMEQKVEDKPAPPTACLSTAMIFVLLLFVLMACGFVVQDFSPAIDWAWHARIFAVPVIYFACAISLPFSVMLCFAFFTGFVWDALNCAVVTYADDRVHHIAATFPDVAAAALQVDAVPPGGSGAFGFSIFLYALLGSMMHGIRPLFRRGRWELPVLMTGAGTFLLLTLEYLFINFRRAGFSFPVEVWHHIAATAVLSMIVAPFAFLLINWLAKLSGYSIRYEGLAYRRWKMS